MVGRTSERRAICKGCVGRNLIELVRNFRVKHEGQIVSKQLTDAELSLNEYLKTREQSRYYGCCFFVE